MPHVTVPCIAVVQHGRSFLITKLQAGLLTRITATVPVVWTASGENKLRLVAG
jgi:hypothetical protein